MRLTKDSRKTTKAHAERDPEYRVTLLRQTIEALLSNDLEMGKELLRIHVKATVGYESLGRDMNKHPKSLMRMLGAKGNPRADSLLAMIACLKRHEGVSFSLSLTRNNGPHI